jgi:hypothetical protein
MARAVIERVGEEIEKAVFVTIAAQLAYKIHSTLPNHEQNGHGSTLENSGIAFVPGMRGEFVVCGGLSSPAWSLTIPGPDSGFSSRSEFRTDFAERRNESRRGRQDCLRHDEW